MKQTCKIFSVAALATLVFICLATVAQAGYNFKKTVTVDHTRVTGGGLAPPAGFSFMKKITVDNTKVSGAADLSDFPVLVQISNDMNLKTTAQGGGVADSNGYDIVFYDATLSTALDHEVEHYDGTTGSLTAWVRISTLKASQDTIFYLCYGNGSIGSSQENIPGVWDTNYIGVWHLKESGTYVDSTSNGYDGTDNVSATGKDGQINGGQQFDGTDDYIDLGPSGIGAEQYQAVTIQAWYKNNGGSLSDYHTIAWFSSDKPGLPGLWPTLHFTVANPSKKIRLQIADSWYDDPWGDAYSASDVVTDEEWHQVVAVRTGGGSSRMKMYVDGVEETDIADLGGGNTLEFGDTSVPQEFYIGAYEWNGSGYTDGGLDEVRLSRIARSKDWIITEYNNQSDPAGFMSIEEIGSLQNFPVLVSIQDDDDLRTTVNGGGVINANGYDIVFYDATETLQLDHEVESYDATTGTLTAWVRIPFLSADMDTVFYLYYGDGSIGASQENAAGVWDSNYQGVWHLAEDVTDEGTTGTHYDATSNDNDGTQSGNVDTTGQIGKGQVFDGTDDIIFVGTGPALNGTTDFALSAWIKTSDGTIQAIMEQRDATGYNGSYRFYINLAETDTGKIVIATYDVGGWSWGADHIVSSVRVDDDNDWHHVAMVRSNSGQTGTLYIDGVQRGTETGTARSLDSNLGVYIGGDFRDNGAYFDGIIDEVRISSSVRDTSWIQTEYNNHNWPNKEQHPAEGFLTVTGGSCDSAVSISCDSTVGGSIAAAGDIKVYELQTSDPLLVNVYTSGATDTYGYLHDSNCEEINQDDNSGVDDNFYIAETLAAGTYYIEVRHQDPGQTGAYDLTVDCRQDDYGDTCTDAHEVDCGSTTAGSIDSGGDEDYFKIVFWGTGVVTLYAEGATDTYGYLLDSDCNTIAADDNSAVDGINFSITRTVSPGEYYIAVKHADPAQSGVYTLQVACEYTPVITATAEYGGSISPSGIVSVPHGTGKSFTITADAGGSISNVWVDGAWVGAVSSYTFDNVTRDHTIVATFNADLLNCVDISDVPLDARLRSAPANIMFVLDDSGSMDWEFITPETSGLFEGYYRYVFDDPGDNLYSRVLPRSVARMKWKSQWNGYNKLYYDPGVEYQPWPEPWPTLAGLDQADPDTPRSHPMHAGPTFDLNQTYHSYYPGMPAVVVDNQDGEPSFATTSSGTAGTTLIVNDRDANFSKTASGGGSWGSSNDSQAYNSDSYYTKKNGNYSATWTPDFGTAGQYEVFARWQEASSRSTAVPYTIVHAGGSDTVSVNQRQNGGQWVTLGIYNFNAGTGGNVSITYTGGGSGDRVCADAIQFVPNSATWDWAADSQAYDMVDDGIDGHYLWTPADGDYTATWTPNIPDPGGSYDVKARWVANANRSTAVPYTIVHAGGSDTVNVDQRQNGGQWVTLGTYNFNAGTGGSASITYTRNGSQDTVCADAVQFVPANLPEVIDITRAHYYVWSQAQSKPYLVVLDGAIDYYEVDDGDGDDLIEDGEMLPAASVPADVQTGRSYIAERQNFANWYQFYRRRELTATGAIARVIDNIQGVQIGFYTINGNLVRPVLRVKVEGVDQSSTLLESLYNLSIRAQGTPLRRGLEEVGKYFHSSSAMIGSSPYAAADSGGNCQQAFAIVMTDGYWNGWNPGVGNEDGDDDSAYDGGIYADTFDSTLADVAMKYYENDLNTDLDNLVPTNFADGATHQHVVTYGVSFGVTGSLNPADYDFDNGVYPTWPYPKAGHAQKIDDLWHAAVNGRGAFLSASNPTELIDSLLTIMRNIESRIASSASVSVNGKQLFEKLHAGTRMFQASYSSDGWTGDVKAYGLNTSSGEVNPEPIWSAAEQLEELHWDTGRIIATYDGSQGIALRYDSLTDAQKTALGSDLVADSAADRTAQNILDFVRGDSGNEQLNGGAFRNRFRVLGDIVNSSPVYHNGVLYVGGNDGMLHAFDTAAGTELFAYVPALVFDHLKELVDPDYPHKFFVDLAPEVAEVSFGAVQRLLVGGLGKGGKGYFALDVTDPSAIADESALAGKVLWEFSDSSDLGYTFSRPVIAQSNDSSAPWIVIFGNGYNSTSSYAKLYILNAADGSLLRKIDTEQGSCNGLSSPVAVDIDNNGTADYVYAGDLKGNLWKFDLTDANANNWQVAFADVDDDEIEEVFPLFQAKGPAANPQPITTKPDVMYHCQKHGYMVVFGTGRYLGDSDFSTSNTQTIYGIWDYADADDLAENLGSFDRPSGIQLSSFNLHPEVSLLQQVEISGSWTTTGGESVRILTDLEPNWETIPDGDGGDTLPNPGSSLAAPDPVHAGWYVDLPESGERVVSDVIIRDGNALVISFIPEQTPCGSGGDSFFHQLNPCTGGRPPEARFDIDDDDTVSQQDLINIGTADDPSWVAPVGISISGRLQVPVVLRMGDVDVNYLSSSRGTIETQITKGVRLGIYYWMQLD